MPDTERRPQKLAIIGAGSVGATLAYACLMRGVARNVVLYDINQAKVEAEALDISHGIQFMPMGTIHGSADIEICRDADMVVVTAGAKQKPGQSRMDLAGATIGLMEKIIPSVQKVAPNAIIMMVTNPVDVVTYASLKISGLPANQLFGSGTVLDSSRLRYLVARELGVAVQNVHAYIAGEHGDTELPLWSSAIIGAAPLMDWRNAQGRGLNEAERERIADEVVNSAYKIIEGKGATNYAIGVAGARIIEAVLRDENAVLPVSSLITEYTEFGEVCMALPTIVNRNGATARILPPLSFAERQGLIASAKSIRETAAKFGY
jgi:L-lactate dehydrogenase